MGSMRAMPNTVYGIFQHHFGHFWTISRALLKPPPRSPPRFSLLMGVHPPWNVPAHAPAAVGDSLQPPSRSLAGADLRLTSQSWFHPRAPHFPHRAVQCQARNGSSRASPRPSRLHGRRLPRRAKRPNRSVRTRIIDDNRHWNHPPTFIKPPCLINFINYRPFLFLPTHRIQISLPLRPGRREDA